MTTPRRHQLEAFACRVRVLSKFVPIISTMRHLTAPSGHVTSTFDLDLAIGLTDLEREALSGFRVAGGVADQNGSLLESGYGGGTADQPD